MNPVVRDAAGIGLAVGAFGLAYGAAAVAAGLSVPQASALSVLTFTGASQFALVSVIGAGGGAVAAAASALLLGARNALYGVRLNELLRPGNLGARVLTAHGVIDETTAMAVIRPDRATARLAFWATFASVWLVWNLTTVLGAVGAQAFGDPTRFGLDAAGPAAFVALLAPRLRESTLDRRVALTGAAVALLFTPLLPPGVPVLLAATGALVGISSAARPERAHRSRRSHRADEARS